MAQRILISNDSPQGFAYDQRFYTVGVAGSLTSDTTLIAFTAPYGFTGEIVAANLVVGANVEDGTDAASLTMTVYKNGTTIFTTAPSIAKAAGSGAKNSFATATGIVAPVLKTDGTEDLTAGDVVKVLFDVTRTTPEVEYTDVTLSLVIRPTAASTIQS